MGQVRAARPVLLSEKTEAQKGLESPLGLTCREMSTLLMENDHSMVSSEPGEALENVVEREYRGHSEHDLECLEGPVGGRYWWAHSRK